jgi:glycosyltransferase involved in cell wall biosynthesis
MHSTGVGGLSVVIITFNEERNIRRCLDSVQGLADEIILVDSFSTDTTRAICKTYAGLRFVQRKWEGYSATKNYANSLALHPYILSLDADEALSDRLRQSILGAKSIGLCGVYRVHRRTNYCGKWIRWSGWYPDAKIRLFPAGQAQWVGDFVHEELVFDSGIPVHRLDGDLLHYSYYTEEEHLQRSRQYALLAARKLHQRGKRVAVWDPWLHGLTRALSKYLLRLGFLDGAAGWRIALISAYGNYLKYSYLRRINRGASVPE